MKKLLITCGLMAALVCHSARSFAAPANYGNKIVAPPEPDKQLQAALTDAETTLKQMTGQTFERTTEYSGPGIYVLRSSDAAAPAEAVAKLKGQSISSFVLRSNDDKVLRVISNSDAGLSNGLYYYLEQLGARWLLPNPNWTVIPEKKDVTLKIDVLKVPDYRFRQFGGTGGFGRSFPYDPGEAERNRARWENWERRLRLGSDNKLGGHSYYAVYLRHKKEFDEHPEYLALVNGKRMSTAHDDIKFDVSNPDLVKLYVQDRIEEFRAARAKDPNYNFVSVEPSDGYNHCNTGACTEIGNGSPSDQVFYLANKVAKALRQEFPDGAVSLYAYNQHAAPPSFDLEPNMYVMIIPYAFQTTGLKPSELIEAWHAKIPRMGIYDYWGMTSWTQDMPTFDYLTVPAERLRFWHKNGVDGFVNESSYSAGAMGLTWYLSSKLMWNVNQPVQPILDDWYQTAFGPARAPMQRMMENWTRSFQGLAGLNSGVIGSSFADLNEARTLAKGHPDIEARLMDFGRYINYLRLLLERDVAKNALAAEQRNKKKDEASIAAATKASNDAALRLQQYLWNIYDSSMIHAFRLNQITKSPAEIKARYQQGKKDAPGWKEITPLSDADIAQMVDEQTKNYPPLGYQLRSYAGSWQPVPATSAGKDLSPEDGYSRAMYGGPIFEIIAPEGLKNVKLKAQMRVGDKGTLQLLDADGQVLQEKTLERTTPDKPFFQDVDVEFSIPQAGRYQIASSGLGVRFPPHVPILISGHFTNSQFLYGGLPHLYFYVPKGLKRIAVSVNYELLPTFYNPAGEKVEPVVKDGGKLFLIDVPAGQDGKVWSVKDLVSPKGFPAVLLNVPEALSFHPDTLYVPADALKPVD
jgi:hypothetical protein